MSNTKVKKRNKKGGVPITNQGYAKIKASFNNVIVTITNESNQVVSWSSAGKMGFKGAKKNTPLAGSTAGADAAKKAHDLGVKQVNVFIKGVGATIEGAVKAIGGVLEVRKIIDVTGVPHNGCRPPKQRKP